MTTDIIYNCDCEKKLLEIPDCSIDMILTDPPYIVKTSNNGGGCLKSTKKIKTGLDDIKNGFDVDFVFQQFERVLKKINIFCCCSNHQISSLMQWGEDRGFITTLLCWHKYNAVPFATGVWRSDLEFCVHIREKGATFKGDARQKSKMFSHPIVISETGHPTEKPLSLFKKYIEIGSNENDIILDPFSGGGTTACACHELNRKFICMEKNEEYYKASVERFENFKRQTYLPL